MDKVTNEEVVTPEVAQTERIGLGDLIIVGVLAVAVYLAQAIWSFPNNQPFNWEDAAAAAGILPASNVLPGYFRLFAHIVYNIAGFNGGNQILTLLGHISLAAIAVCVYAALREMLAFIMRARPQFSKRRSIVQQIAAAVGSVAFVFADPVWSVAGQCFSPVTVKIILTLAVIEFFFVFLRKGTLKYAYLCAFFLGLLTAETPMGLVLLAIFIFINNFVLRVMPGMESPFFKPAVIAVGKWYMTFIFILMFVVGVGVNCVAFKMMGGLTSTGGGVGSIPLSYAMAYWGTITSASSMMGWLLMFGVALFPFVVALIRFPAAADEDIFLAYSTGVVFLFCGVLMVAQSASIPDLWFWKYGPVASTYLLSFANLLCATTLAMAVSIMGVDALCRDHARLADQLYGVRDNGDDDEDEELKDAAKVASSNEDTGFTISAFSHFIRRFGLITVPVVIILVMIPGRVKEESRDMVEIVNDVISEIVTESEGCEYIFTDGNLDTGIELESMRRGGNLKCLSLLGKGGSRDVYLRTRGIKDAEDLMSFQFDTGMGLRTWIRDRQERLKNCSLLMGFDLWKREGLALPPYGGLVSRPFGWAQPEEQAASIKRAHELAKRILGVYANGGYKKCTSPTIKRAFLSAQWRVARMCTYRAEQFDLQGDASAAIFEVELAKQLNDNNETYQQIVKAMTKANENMMSRLTPREGLQLALVRADFRMGKMYADAILQGEPENPEANFAMGMFYVREKQYTRAEVYLKRCLIKNPLEPAVYNNLAMVQMALGKYDAALINVNKALEIIPDSAAVQDTRKQILKAKSAIEDKQKK